MIRPFLLLLLLLLASVGAAEPLTFARLQQAAEATTTMRLPFTQEKDLALFDEPVRSAGVIELDRARGALRWEFTARSVLILRERTVRKWGADGKEEAGPGRDPGLAALSGQMQAMLTGDWRTVEDFFAIAIDPIEPRLTLTPKQPALAKYIARIAIAFRDDLSAPSTLVLEAAGGDLTTYRFSDPQVDVAIAEGRFSGP